MHATMGWCCTEIQVASALHRTRTLTDHIPSARPLLSPPSCAQEGNPDTIRELCASNHGLASVQLPHPSPLVENQLCTNNNTSTQKPRDHAAAARVHVCKTVRVCGGCDTL
jgi:hypothetical protein